MAIVVVTLVAMDQASKWLVESHLNLHEKVEIVPFWALYRTHNEGIAFSFLAGINDHVLVALTVLIIVFVGWMWSRTPQWAWVSHLGFALIMGGAIGNLVDRVLLGYVVDFILFHTPVWSFAIFNLADSFITIGAAAIIMDELVLMRRKEHTPVQGE